MLMFVDTEHASGYLEARGEWLMAQRTRIKYRLEDVANDEVYLARYDRVDRDLIDRLGVKGIFLSGSGSELSDYGSERDGLFDVIRALELPMFGFCGGLQMMAVALGSEVALIGELDEGEEDLRPETHPGMKKEYGYLPVSICAEHPILDAVGPAPVVRHAHAWELKEIPRDFGLHATTDASEIQMIIHDHLPVMGTQFHPEYWTDEHPAGRRMIKNFCDYAGL